MDNLKRYVLELENELLDLRRDFHRHPELGYKEYRTSKIVYNYLKELGIEVNNVSGTGVVGVLRGAENGKTIMLRADLDALPQTEKTDLPFKSVNEGIMHACGHDGHTAMLMVAAKILTSYKNDLKGNVKFVFQPNEEEAGALDMINEGVLLNPDVSAAFAVHLWTPIESGYIGLSSGPVMAALEEFELEIFGLPGHTGSPHTAKDPIIVASNIIQTLQTIQTREIDPLMPITIMIGSINGGTGRNIVADKVIIGGTIRYLFENEHEEKKLLLEKFKRVISGICDAMDVDYKLRFIPSNPSLQNDKNLLKFVVKAASDTFGTENNILEYRCMAGEDFAEFSQRVPSVFYFIGNGNKEKRTNYPHHHPMFALDEDTLKYGVEMHVRTVLNYLKHNKKEEEY